MHKCSIKQLMSNSIHVNSIWNSSDFTDHNLMNLSEIVPGLVTVKISVHQLRCVIFIAVCSFFVVYYFPLDATEKGFNLCL